MKHNLFVFKYLNYIIININMNQLTEIKKKLIKNLILKYLSKDIPKEDITYLLNLEKYIIKSENKQPIIIKIKDMNLKRKVIKNKYK